MHSKIIAHKDVLHYALQILIIMLILVIIVVLEFVQLVYMLQILFLEYAQAPVNQI